MKNIDDTKIKNEIDEITEKIDKIMKKVEDILPDKKEKSDQKED